MATLAELLTAPVRALGRMGSASGQSASTLRAFEALQRQAQADSLMRAQAPGASVRGALAQLGDAYQINTPPPPRDPDAPPPLARKIQAVREGSPAALLERRLQDLATPTARADGTFDSNIFAAYNDLERLATNPAVAGVVDELASSYGITNEGNLRQYLQRVANAVVNEGIARQNASADAARQMPNVVDTALPVTSSAADSLSGPEAVALRSGPTPSSPDRTLGQMPDTTQGLGPAPAPMPPTPMERLIVARHAPYLVEVVPVMDPSTGRPLLDQDGNIIPSRNVTNPGTPLIDPDTGRPVLDENGDPVMQGRAEEVRLRSQEYLPTSARRSAYRRLVGQAKFYPSVVDESGADSVDRTRELTVLERGAGTNDRDRVYLLPREDGTFHMVDPVSPDAGRLLSAEAVRDLLESQGYVQLTGPELMQARPGVTEGSFAEVAGRRLFETMNPQADVTNPVSIQETLRALEILERSGGGERFVQAMVTAGKGDADTADRAMMLIRRRRKAMAADRVRQQLAMSDAADSGDPERVAGALAEHPAFAGEPEAEILAYASMPAEELSAAAALRPNEAALVTRFQEAFREGSELYERAKTMLPASAPELGGESTVSGQAQSGASGVIDVESGVDPEGPVGPIGPEAAVRNAINRTRTVEQVSGRPSQVSSGDGPADVRIDAAAPGGSATFEGPVPADVSMAELALNMLPASDGAAPQLPLLDRLRAMASGRPDPALNFTIDPNSWAAGVTQPQNLTPMGSRMDVGGRAGPAVDAVSAAENDNVLALKAFLARRRAESSVAGDGDGVTQAVFAELRNSPEFAMMSDDDVMDYASAPLRDLEIRRKDALDRWNAARSSGGATQTVGAGQAPSSSVTRSDAASRGGALQEDVAADPLDISRAGPADQVVARAIEAQGVFRSVLREVDEFEVRQKQVDALNDTVSKMIVYLDEAESGRPVVSRFTGRAMPSDPAARIQLYEPFRTLPQELRQQVLAAGRGELQGLFDSTWNEMQAMEAQAATNATRRQEALAGLERAKQDARNAQEAIRASRESTGTTGMDGRTVEDVARPEMSEQAAAEEAERQANRAFASQSGNASALGARPRVPAEQREAIVREVLGIKGGAPLPMAFRDFDTHEGGVSESAVERVRDLEARLESASTAAERRAIESELRSTVSSLFGPGPREKFNRKAGGINLLEPSGVNQNRLVRALATAETPGDRVGALRELFGQRVMGRDLSDGLENLRRLAADGRLGTMEDIIQDELLRRMDFAEAQRAALSSTGETLEDSALDGFSPAALRQVAETAVRDMESVAAGPQRTLPAQPAPRAPADDASSEAVTRRLLSAGSAGDRLSSVRDLLGDGQFSELRDMAARGMTSSAEDALFDNLIKKWGNTLEGVSPEDMRAAAAAAARDLASPAAAGPLPDAPVAAAPESRVRSAMQRLVDIMARAGSYITGLDSTAPKQAAEAAPYDANEYLLSTLPTREQILEARGTELDTLVRNVMTARRNAQEIASGSGADLSRFDSEAESRLSDLARRMQQPGANYTPPAVDKGPLGFDPDSLDDGAEEAPVRRAPAEKPKGPAPLSIPLQSSRSVPSSFGGSLQISREQYDDLQSWLGRQAAPGLVADHEEDVAGFLEQYDQVRKNPQDRQRLLADFHSRAKQRLGDDSASVDGVDLQVLDELLMNVGKPGRRKALDRAYQRAAHAMAVIDSRSRLPLGSSQSGPPEFEVTRAVDQDGRPTVSLKATQTIIVNGRPTRVSKVVSGAQLDVRRQAGIGEKSGDPADEAVGTLLGEPDSGLYALDLDELGRPVQARMSGDRRGLPDAVRQESFDGPVIIGERPIPPYEGESFSYDDPQPARARNSHEASVRAAEQKGAPEPRSVEAETPSARTGETAAKPSDGSTPGKSPEEAAADRVNRARRRSAAIGAVLAGGTVYMAMRPEGTSATAGDIVPLGASGGDTKDTAEDSAGSQVRRARARRSTLMTPSNPTYW